MQRYERTDGYMNFSPMLLVVPFALGLFAVIVLVIVRVLPHIQAVEVQAASKQNAVILSEGHNFYLDRSEHLADFFNGNIYVWEDEILAWSDAFELDPNLIATVMQIESCGNPYAVSSASARGLFQVMPYHFSAGEYMHDPNTNALRGLTYLKDALAYHNGDVRLALAAYNGGLTTSTWDEVYWPEETQNYVYWGEQIFYDAYYDLSVSPRFNEWFQVGYPLCQSTDIGYSK